jgi:hypothetical protein
LKQARVLVELIEPHRRHKPRKLHLAVHPGCVAW